MALTMEKIRRVVRPSIDAISVVDAYSQWNIVITCVRIKNNNYGKKEIRSHRTGWRN